MLDHEFPVGFKPVNIEAYDGTTDPGVWIEDYILHIHMARGDDLHAIKYLPLKLKGPARHWLKLGRQEWNKTLGKRPSLPPFTKYIDALII